jgi:copper(I)-binding protein
MRPVFFSLFVLALSACGPAPSSVAPLNIEEAYAAPSPAGVDLAAGYLTIANTGAEDRLIGAASPRAASVALHAMEMDGAVMRMRMVDGMIAPAGGELILSPGGDHLMFTGLTAPFAIGEIIPLTLTFEHAGAIEIALPVRSGGAGHSGH